MDFNPLLTERARLLIMAALAAVAEGIDFVALVEATKLSKGNLSSHIKKLEDAGFVKVTKEFVDRKPLTRLFCTDHGRSELRAHLAEVERVLKGL